MPHFKLVRDAKGVLREVSIPIPDERTPRRRRSPQAAALTLTPEAQMEQERVARVLAAKELRRELVEGTPTVVGTPHQCEQCGFQARSKMGLMAHTKAKHAAGE